MKRILWAANTYWHSPFQVGANHLCRELANREYNCFFLSDPISLMHFFKKGNRDDVYDCFKDWRRGVQIDDVYRVRFYSPFTPFWVPLNYPFLRSQYVLDSWHKFTVPNVSRVLRKYGFQDVDLLVIDTIANGFLLDQIKWKRSVLRITDNLAGFTRATPTFLRREQELAQRVDLVVYTAQSLESRVNQLKPKNRLFLPNGVNAAHFTNAANRSVPADLVTVKKPIVLYVGAMNFWFDWEMVNFAAESLPDVSFVFVGPEKLAVQNIIQRRNVHILGRRPYDVIPDYMRCGDVGIIPFDVVRHPDLVHAVNPIKMYEYLACGVPVVARRWRELDCVKSPAVLVENKQEFVSAIGRLLSERPQREVLQTFARSHDWGNRADRLLRQLRDLS